MDVTKLTKEERAKLLVELGNAQFRGSIKEEYADRFDEDHKLSQGLGILLAAAHDYSSHMFITFAYACEDANLSSSIEDILAAGGCEDVELQ